MEAFITLEEMITDIGKGDAFDLEYVSVDLKRGTGGQQKAVTNATLASNYYAALHQQKEAGKRKPISGQSKRSKTTMVVYVPASKEKKERIRTIHLRLITLYNGKQVL